MRKSRPICVFTLTALAPVLVTAELVPLNPGQITPGNGDAALRCAMLTQLAKNAGFFADVPNGELMGDRLNDRMLEIARNAAPDITDNKIVAAMKAAFADYDALAADGDATRKGEMMKADFQTCLERAGELFGKDLLPDE